MSILRMVIIASNARLAAALSGLLLARSSARGVICHEKPQRSSYAAERDGPRRNLRGSGQGGLENAGRRETNSGPGAVHSVTSFGASSERILRYCRCRPAAESVVAIEVGVCSPEQAGFASKSRGL